MNNENPFMRCSIQKKCLTVSLLLLLVGLGMPARGDLIAHYTLDETGGTVANDSVTDPNDFSGELNNTDFDAASTTNAVLGNAVIFDGSYNFIQLERTTAQTAPPPLQQVPALGLQEFTLAAWFNRTGSGTTGSTGTGAITGTAIISKGTGQADGDNRDMNYWMGIDSVNNVIAGDFESIAATDNNHPFRGVTAIENNTWYHIALIYDGNAIALYLNGLEEARLETTDAPRSDSIQPAAIGAALQSNGNVRQLFEGLIDDVRIYNHPLNESEVRKLYTDVITEYCTEYPTADITGPDGEPDCRVDMYDLTLLASQWLVDNMVSSQ